MTETVANSPSAVSPECIVLGVRPGVRPSGRPPVRIFLGTEPSQYRAERVFLWSIEQVRDPGRVYEIHLMKALPGFRTRFWNTGFTNYRFAIPELAGRRGRAIYNDVDQVYLADPAELFDMDLGPHGYLAVSRTDTSVMVMDCERMIRAWPLAGAQRRRKYRLIARALAMPDSWGPLPGEWNARDEEYVEGRSKCVHFTTLHRQPWQPFPQRFHYQPNVHGELFYEMERQADRAGFHVFGAGRPSRRFLALDGDEGARPGPESEGLAVVDGVVRELAGRTGARRLLEVASGSRALETVMPKWGAPRVDRIGVLTLAELGEETPRYDGVVVTADLETLPAEDLPWIVDRTFGETRGFVVAAVPESCEHGSGDGHGPSHPASRGPWWSWMFDSASRHRGGVHWRLAITRGPVTRAVVADFRRGGAFPGTDAPRVWVLADHKPGHTNQSLGLAEELGWPYELIRLEFNPLSEGPNTWVRESLRSLRRDCARRLQPPWPDLVIAAGRRTAPVASWIRKQSCGRTQTVQIGRLGAFRGDRFDLAVAPAYAGLYPDSRRIETAAPLTRVMPAALASASLRWSRQLKEAPSPRIALLVGGTNAEHVLTTADAAAMGREIAEMARREGGTVLATTSRRTSAAAADALEEALGDTCASFHRWDAGRDPHENPYLGYLAVADALIVSGESASMLAEACATGKPVYIYPLPPRTRGPIAWARSLGRLVAHAVSERAHARPLSRRRIEKPQRGVRRFCAGLLARGIVRANGHSRRLHDDLVARGLAHVFDGRLDARPAGRLSEVGWVAGHVRQLMGIDPPPAQVGPGGRAFAPRPRSRPSARAES